MDANPKDITKKFMDSCKLCLEHGMLAHEPNFCLLFVMSAIDIMNPSMDVAMTKERKVVFLQDAIADGVLPLGHFEDPTILLGVIDELLVLLCNWLTGDSLLQTVYTCMYMHCIPIIKDDRLAIFCEGLRRVIMRIRRLILTSSSFHEEDFSPSPAGVPLYLNTHSFFPNNAQANSYYDLSDLEIVTLLRNMSENVSTCVDTIGCAIVSRLSMVAHLLEFGIGLEPLLDVLGKDEYEELRRAGPFILDGNGRFGPDDMCQEDALTSQKFKIICDSLRSVSTSIVEASKVMLESADCGKEAGPGKSNPRSDFFSIPGFEPFLTLPSLTASVQRLPRNLSRRTAFSFLGCAFTRIIEVLQQINSLIDGNNIGAVFLHDLFSVAHSVGHNLCHSLFEKVEAADNLQIKDACSKSCVLSRAVMDILMKYLVRCPLRVSEDFFKAINLTPSGTHFLSSWLSIECSLIRNSILDCAGDLAPHFSFFEHIFSQLFSICESYSFNRSRQRSNMERIFQSLNELVEDTVSVESAISIELEENFVPPKGFVFRPHLTAYICFFYYHLAWDYLSSGFQLKLYSSYEWVYVYALFITLQRNLSAFLDHITKDSLVDTSKCFAKRRRKPGAHPSNPKDQGDATIRKEQNSHARSLSSSVKLPITSPRYWNYQIAQSNIHRFLSIATLYVIRALQKDAEVDLIVLSSPLTKSDSLKSPLESQRKFYSSLKSQFLSRIGPISNPRFSPLVDNEGPEAFFKSTYDYVMSKTFVESSSKDIYQMAQQLYDVARQWIIAAQSLNLCTSNLGPVDSLDQLDRLAKQNEIVCRLLVSYPDKRPKKRGNKSSEGCYEKNNSGESSVRFPKGDFYPVHLNFDFLPSRVYPILHIS